MSYDYDFEFQDTLISNTLRPKKVEMPDILDDFLTFELNVCKSV